MYSSAANLNIVHVEVSVYNKYGFLFPTYVVLTKVILKD